MNGWLIDWLVLFGGIFLVILGGNSLQMGASQHALGLVAIVYGLILIWNSIGDSDGNHPFSV